MGDREGRLYIVWRLRHWGAGAIVGATFTVTLVRLPKCWVLRPSYPCRGRPACLPYSPRYAQYAALHCRANHHGKTGQTRRFAPTNAPPHCTIRTATWQTGDPHGRLFAVKFVCFATILMIRTLCNPSWQRGFGFEFRTTV
jgi:hypothetical protein